MQLAVAVLFLLFAGSACSSSGDATPQTVSVGAASSDDAIEPVFANASAVTSISVDGESVTAPYLVDAAANAGIAVVDG